MTRTKAIAEIEAVLPTLADEQVQALADLARRWTEPSVYSTLSAKGRAEIDAALDRLDAGQGVPGATVLDRIDARIAAAKRSG
ncbi:MAG: hypothetical protein ACKVP7_22385 [Hyphomicrobiaceae bacterium]